MALFPIEHPTRLRSPVQAEALYRRLGETRVGLRGFRTSEAALVDRLVAALDPACDTSFTFEHGILDGSGWSRLEELAHARPAYLEVHAGAAQLRAWPAQAKVYARLPEGGVPAIGEAIGAPLRPGENRIGDTTIMIDPVAGYPLAVAVTAADHAIALRMFRALGGAEVPRGLVKGANEPAKAALAPLARGLGAMVHVVLDVSVERACELAMVCPELKHDWQASMVLVDFPGGRIHGFVKPPNDRDREREVWLARVDKALEGSIGPTAE